MLVGSAVASTKATAGRTGTVVSAGWDNSNDTAVYHVRCSNGDMIELTHAETVAATLSFRGSAVATTAKGGGKAKAKSKGYSKSVWQYTKKAQAEADVQELAIEESLRQHDGQTGRDRNQGRRRLRRRQKRGPAQSDGEDVSEEDEEDDAPSQKKAKVTVEEEDDMSNDNMDVELPAQVMATTVAGVGGEARRLTGRPRAESVNGVDAPSDMIVEAPPQAGPPPSQVASAADQGGSASTTKKKRRPRSSGEKKRTRKKNNTEAGERATQDPLT